MRTQLRMAKPCHSGCCHNLKHNPITTSLQARVEPTTCGRQERDELHCKDYMKFLHKQLSIICLASPTMGSSVQVMKIVVTGEIP